MIDHIGIGRITDWVNNLPICSRIPFSCHSPTTAFRRSLDAAAFQAAVFRAPSRTIVAALAFASVRLDIRLPVLLRARQALLARTSQPPAHAHDPAACCSSARPGVAWGVGQRRLVPVRMGGVHEPVIYDADDGYDASLSAHRSLCTLSPFLRRSPAPPCPTPSPPPVLPSIVSRFSPHPWHIRRRPSRTIIVMVTAPLPRIEVPVLSSVAASPRIPHGTRITYDATAARCDSGSLGTTISALLFLGMLRLLSSAAASAWFHPAAIYPFIHLFILLLPLRGPSLSFSLAVPPPESALDTTFRLITLCVVLESPSISQLHPPCRARLHPPFQIPSRRYPRPRCGVSRLVSFRPILLSL
ncbi:hypothetical protein MSAN_00510200 [Mycena sanguinolenta]|uniref:Uncharacterized protein n=1 Tax=Mycena sanguinolenta TaxID=230812 RepID=A0A8H6Z916_9AGAR|nr:hypothetical protein MSAN_00510200 [Mycena sanguinolenta]